MVTARRCLIAIWMCMAVFGLHAQDVLRFIYCSDLHYGIRREFRGGEVDADVVNREMLKAFRLLPDSRLPEDGGVEAGKLYGKADFVVCTGDIANRMQKGAWTAEHSWRQFEKDWKDAVDVSVYLVPGNHDISNAIGHPKGLDRDPDATSAAGIFNRTMHPARERTAQTFDYAVDKVRYSFVRDSVRFVFAGMWIDSGVREWMDSLLRTDKDMPAFLFTHDAVEPEAKHFMNPNGSHSINAGDGFENLLSDTACVRNVKETPLCNWHELEMFFAAHPQIKGYFHGDYNYNEFYTWHGTEGSVSLPVFRVDSPMKGEISSVDETRLSFIVVCMDTQKHLLTARECLWNRDGKTGIHWGESVTIAY